MDDKFRSRKWILHRNTWVWVVSVATSLAVARLLGVTAAPDVSSTLTWAATTVGVVLGAYSTANIIAKKKNGGD